MISVQRRMVLTYLCNGLLALAVGCKDTGHPDQGQNKRIAPIKRYGGTYHKSFELEPLTLDPAFLTDVYATSAAQQLFDGLVQFDADLNVVPGIAKFWEASHDGLVWTFHLRQGVKFHHGREVNADDFVYTFTRLLHPQTASPRSWLLERVHGAKQFLASAAERVEGCSARDAYTLQMTLSQPYAPLISILGMAQTRVLPREEVERLGADFGRQPVGTGPFRFVKWVAGEEIILEANEAYYEGRPFLDRLHYRIITDPQAAMVEFERGTLEDVRLPAHQPAPPKFFRKPLLTTLFVLLETRHGPLSNRKVRQAINYAINREAMSTIRVQNRFMQARGILPLGMPGYNPNLRGYPYDLPRARQLLAEAGYPEGRDLPSLELWTSVPSPTALQEHEALKRDLERLGLKVELFTAESWKHYMTAILGKRPGGMYRYLWVADFPDPDTFLFSLFHSQSPDNYANYSNPEVDRLLEQARSESDYLKRIEAYRQAEALIMEDAPAVNLVYDTFAYLSQPYVQGIELN